MVEKMGYNVDPEWTPQTARLWTETSPNSKLENINTELSSFSWNKVDKLKELIKKREYVKFQKEIWLTNKKDLDWKLWQWSLNKLKTYLKTLDETEAKEVNLDEERKKVDNLCLSIITPENINGRINQTDELRQKIGKAAKKYLSKYEKLSTSDCNLLFSKRLELRQWYLWDCYLIAWLIELSNSQYFDALVRTSISRVRCNDWGLWWVVKIPLWEPDARDILIKDNELYKARVNWDIGYKLLEIAYVKNRRPNNKTWNEYYPVTDEEIDSIEWWYTLDALKTLLWKKNVGSCDFWSFENAKKWLDLHNLPQSAKNEIKNYLKNFDWSTWNNYTEIGTFNISTKVWKYELFPSHAYALVGVETENWEITYINVKEPRGKDNAGNLRLTLDEFFDAFAYIKVGKINVDTFLDDIWDSYA